MTDSVLPLQWVFSFSDTAEGGDTWSGVVGNSAKSMTDSVGAQDSMLKSAWTLGSNAVTSGGVLALNYDFAQTLVFTNYALDGVSLGSEGGALILTDAAVH
jgi:hypothetical protein